LGACFDLPVHERQASAFQESGAASCPVSLESPADCPLYVGRVFENLKVGPSPAWLVQKLESIGLRSINNLVDITNYVLMDIGQPLHLFDLDRLKGPEIRVRRGKIPRAR